MLVIPWVRVVFVGSFTVAVRTTPAVMEAAATGAAVGVAADVTAAIGFDGTPAAGWTDVVMPGRDWTVLDWATGSTLATGVVAPDATLSEVRGPATASDFAAGWAFTTGSALTTDGGTFAGVFAAEAGLA